MADSVGRIQLDLGVNTNGFKQQMNGLAGTAKNASGKITSALSGIGKAVGIAFSVAAIVNFGKKCLELGSDLAEVQNVVDVTFGSMSEQVNAWSKNAITQFGLSEKVAKEYMGTFGAMSKAFGNTTEMAYEQASALTGLSADVASFYNLSTDEAFTKLKAVYTGETEGLKSLGVVMTQTALDEFALQQGMGKTTKNMSEQEKVALRLAFVQDKLAGASGDFARTSGGWANQTRVLALRFDALKASIGQGLINLLTPVVQLLNKLIAKLQVAADAFRDFMAAIFVDAGGASSTATAMEDSSAALADNMESGASAASAIKKSLAGFDKINVLSGGSDSSGSDSGTSGGSSIGGSVADSVGAGANQASELAKKLETALDNIKKKLVEITRVTGLDTMFEKMGRSVENVKKGVGNLFESFKKAIANNAPNLEEFKNSLKNTFETASQTITTIWGDIWEISSQKFAEFTEESGPKIEEFLTNTIGSFTNFSTNISDAIGDIYASAGDWWDNDGSRIFGEVLDCIADVENWFLDLYNKYISPIIDNIIADGKKLWDEHLKPLWDDLLEALTSIWDFIKMLWDKILKPVVDWIIERLGPVVTDIINSIVDFVMDLYATVVDIVRGVVKIISGLLDFITGVFTGDWEKAWNGIKKYFEGIWTGLWGIVKGVINMIIDALNTLWSGVYYAIRNIIDGFGGIANALGKLFGQDDWGWKMPANAPKIPRLATGGYVTANTPQLAIIGDNKREGEIVAPESKIAEAVARGVSAAIGGMKQNQQPAYITLKLGEDTFWEGFVDYHNSTVKRTGASPLLV